MLDNSISSYSYAGNNPVFFNDPLGDRKKPKKLEGSGSPRYDGNSGYGIENFGSGTDSGSGGSPIYGTQYLPGNNSQDTNLGGNSWSNTIYTDPNGKPTSQEIFTGPGKQQGVTVTVTNNIIGFTTVRGYPTNVVDSKGKVLYEVPVYQVQVSNDTYSANFTAIRFGVTTRTGTPTVKGVVSGTYNSSWGGYRGGAFHVDGASNGGVWIHDGPRNLNTSGWGFEGCIGITGPSGWDDFKDLMYHLAPPGTPITVIFMPTEIPSLVIKRHY